MSQDYTNSKTYPGSQFPYDAVDSSWQRIETLIDPGELKAQYLWGIPLVSAFKNPITGKADVLTDDTLKTLIKRAVGIAETECQIDIFPVQKKEKHPWNHADYQSWGYLQLRSKPIASIEALQIVSSDGHVLYDVPLSWVDVGLLGFGQLNIIPLIVPTNNQSLIQPPGPSAASIFLTLFSNSHFVPQFWVATFTVGFKDGKVPQIINELIATIASMETLSMLAATYARSTSTSLGIDSMSQSITSPGPQLFLTRIAELKEKRALLVGKIRAQFATNFYSDSI